ncbi:MAG: hypothetical protein HY532_03815 [Chloroflexi bacterium]|nr:hypothetical protein [Chloroflexota bacterium]
MNIFFDVDYTWLSLDQSLRPGTKETMERLLTDGHKIYIWSGVGIRWQEVHQHNLTPYVTDCFIKPVNQYAEKAAQMNLPAWPDLVIDDYPEVVAAFGGFFVRPYIYVNRKDDEMEILYRLITEVAQTGKSEDRRYRPKVTPNGWPH